MMLNMKKPCYFLTLFVFVISFAVAQDAGFERFFYLGTVGEDAVQLELTLNGTETTGNYFYKLIGAPIELRGSQTGDPTDTGQLYTLEELDENGKAVATFKGELSSDALEFGNTFTGQWSGNNGVTLPFKLERVAEFAEVSFKQNRIESSVVYPVFTGKLAGFNTTIDQTKQVKQTLADFEQGQGMRQDNELYHAWTITADHSIIYASERLLSLLETINSYTGGAHGNLGFASHNFLKDEDGVRKLELRDLFIENTDLKPILEFITETLKQQNASFIMDGSVTLTEADISVFTLSPKGLTFHFSPYSVASYAEGPLEVTVPFELIKDSLRPEIASEFLG
jgi:Protein of unknown function (DUF3298)/Deacetylase PdaC